VVNYLVYYFIQNVDTSLHQNFNEQLMNTVLKYLKIQNLYKIIIKWKNKGVNMLGESPCICVRACIFYMDHPVVLGRRVFPTI